VLPHPPAFNSLPGIVSLPETVASILFSSNYSNLLAKLLTKVVFFCGMQEIILHGLLRLKWLSNKLLSLVCLEKAICEV